MQLDQASKEQLQLWEQTLTAEYQNFLGQNLKLDLTRGKPSAQQLDLSNQLDGILDGDYQTQNGVDTRNYGGLEGIAESRKLGAEILGVQPEEVLAGGNASLTLIYQAVAFSYLFTPPEGVPWKDEGNIKFLCPVPGYDRHFAICEDLGIKMIPVPMTADGPDMDMVEELVSQDSAVKGIWCVPKYSNPTGAIYSDETVERIAKLGNITAPNFRVFWDNAYAVHDLVDNPRSLANIMDKCREFGTENSVWQFASTSKITLAGAGVAFIAASEANINFFKKHLGITSIGPDKVNQLRHAKMFPDVAALKQHMRAHAERVKPRFDTVLKYLEANFADNDLGEWETPEGGYFISFNTRPGLAKEVVKLSGEAGVVLTPAGATFPYGNDPDDSNIRLAPTFPSIDDVDATMQVFVTCVKLASVRQQLTTI